LKLFRGYLALIVVSLGMLSSDLIQRLIIGPWTYFRPANRQQILTWWINWLSWLVTRPIELVGGGSIQRPSTVPCEPGSLILMNHQSVFDVALAEYAVQDGYANIVMRRRYTRWIPLISHLGRLYQYPWVDPTANPGGARRMLKALRKSAVESQVPTAIFPEGTRSKDGEIGPFRPAGLSVILKSRPWTVHAYVIDGLWQHAKFKHLIGSMSDIKGRCEFVGTFEWTDPKADPAPFVAEIRERMIEYLKQMREASDA
jgi:1-acyl-sn-glycerol-3-phosphate acyltransferase